MFSRPRNEKRASAYAVGRPITTVTSSDPTVTMSEFTNGAMNFALLSTST